MFHVHPRRLVAAIALALTAALLTAWTAAATPNPGPVVTLGSTDVGRVLIDGHGHTLYLYAPDKKNTSTCYGQCAKLWPPLLVSATAKAKAAHGVKPSLLATTKRKDGKLQVTYAGHPLYRFTGDAKPGQTSGQNSHAFGADWYVVSSAGKKIEKASR